MEFATKKETGTNNMRNTPWGPKTNTFERGRDISVIVADSAPNSLRDFLKYDGDWNAVAAKSI